MIRPETLLISILWIISAVIFFYGSIQIDMQSFWSAIEALGTVGALIFIGFEFRLANQQNNENFIVKYIPYLRCFSINSSGINFEKYDLSVCCYNAPAIICKIFINDSQIWEGNMVCHPTQNIEDNISLDTRNHRPIYNGSILKIYFKPIHSRSFFKKCNGTIDDHFSYEVILDDIDGNCCNFRPKNEKINTVYSIL